MVKTDPLLPLGDDSGESKGREIFTLAHLSLAGGLHWADADPGAMPATATKNSAAEDTQVA